MMFADYLICLFLLIFSRQTSGKSFESIEALKYFIGLSYNQPIFCPNASWNENATTFASSDTIGGDPYDIFITTNNTVYVPNKSNKFIIVWPDASLIPSRNISTSSSSIRTAFVAEDNSIYFDY